MTICPPSQNGHALTKIDFTDGENNEYSRNIQIAEMNALNAALAVIHWKKLIGFYVDPGRERFTSYSVSTNEIVNGEIEP